MPIPFSFLQDKIRMGKKTLTYRQLFVPQLQIGAIEKLCDGKNKIKVKKKNGKGYKEIKPPIAKGKITHIYFRFKKELTIEESCAEQGREIPKMPVPHRDLFTAYQTYSYHELLELRERVNNDYVKAIPEVKQALFAIQWQIESCLAIIKKSWRMLTNLNGGDKPNGIIIRWDWLGEFYEPQQDIRNYSNTAYNILSKEEN